MTNDSFERVCGSCEIGRRAFLTHSALLAAAAALAACNPDEAMSLDLAEPVQIDVASLPELANVGGIALLASQGVPFAIVRTGSSTYLALSRVCPHQGQTITTNSGGFRCPGHGATFTSTGSWTGGERTNDMRAFHSSYNASTGVLTVTN